MVLTRALRPAARAVRTQGWICDTCLKSRSGATRPHTSINLQRNSALALAPPTLTRRHRESKKSVRPFSTTSFRHAAPRRQEVLPEKPVRTRFAPSPTGHLHIGGLRTALFSYLLAKRTGGQFLLRIEDTDQKRLVEGAEEALLDDLKWAGLRWDEGPQVGGPYGPYKQSERTAIYQEHARQLLDNKAAYRCFCTPQTAGQGTAAYVTSGCYQDCAASPLEEATKRGDELKKPFTFRLKQQDHKTKRIYPDLVYGKITPLKRSPTAVASADDDAGVDAADTILIKSDGTPTYHFANVVDDHLMKITHVIRGSEWMASTPLHYDLYHAFGWEPPVFAHVGLLVDENKAKLSKRNNADLALDVKSMREEYGVSPETLVNFLALLGWSNPSHNDVMGMQAMINIFDLKFTKGNTMVRMEKLWFLQKHHVARRCEQARSKQSMEPVRDIVKQISREVVRQYGAELPGHEDPEKLDDLQKLCYAVLMADSKSFSTAKQFVQRIRYLFVFDLSEQPEEKEYYGKKYETRSLILQKAAEDAMLKDLGYPEDGTDIVQRIHGALHARLKQHVDDCIKDDMMQTRRGKELSNSPGQDLSLHWPNYEKQLEAGFSSLMQWMRERLCGGLPGPSIPIVMSLLGYRECCRRLGLLDRANLGPGWDGNTADVAAASLVTQ